MYRRIKDSDYIQLGNTTIPNAPDNPSYQKYLEWVAQGNTPDPPDHVNAQEEMLTQRMRLLRETDAPWGLADYQHPDKQAWLDYRQALRDLPATAEPQLDEFGNLTNVDWPVKPEPADGEEE